MSGCSKGGIGADRKQLRSLSGLMPAGSGEASPESKMPPRPCHIYKESSELQEQEKVFVELRDMPVNTTHGWWQVLDQPGIHTKFRATWGCRKEPASRCMKFF